MVRWQLAPRVREGDERRDERAACRVHLALRVQARSFKLPMLELKPGRQRRHHMLLGRRDEARRTERRRGQRRRERGEVFKGRAQVRVGEELGGARVLIAPHCMLLAQVAKLDGHLGDRALGGLQ